MVAFGCKLKREDKDFGKFCVYTLRGVNTTQVYNLYETNAPLKAKHTNKKNEAKLKGSWCFFCYYSTYLFSKDLLLKHSWKGRHWCFRAARFNWINMAQIHAMTPLHASPELFEPTKQRGGQHVKVNIWANIFWEWFLQIWLFSGDFLKCEAKKPWFRVKWNEVPEKQLQHLVHFCSQIWSNHFCHTSGNLYLL